MYKYASSIGFSVLSYLFQHGYAKLDIVTKIL